MMHDSEARPKKSRHRGGKLEVLYGGYATWTDRSGNYQSREVRVWGPPEWDPSYYDANELHEAIQAKARKRWPAAECRECWRY